MEAKTRYLPSYNLTYEPKNRPTFLHHHWYLAPRAIACDIACAPGDTRTVMLEYVDEWSDAQECEITCACLAPLHSTRRPLRDLAKVTDAWLLSEFERATLVDMLDTLAREEVGEKLAKKLEAQALLAEQLREVGVSSSMPQEYVGRGYSVCSRCIP